MVRAWDDYHVRSIQSANPDGSLTCYCAIDEGSVMTVGEPVDRNARMDALYADIAAEVGPVDRIIAFDCVLNRIDAVQRQVTRAVSELYGRHRMIGFNTERQQYHEHHATRGREVGREGVCYAVWIPWVASK